MLHPITPEEIAALEQLLSQYHAKHASSYGPKAECTEIYCLEAKWDIDWLKARVSQREH